MRFKIGLRYIILLVYVIWTSCSVLPYSDHNCNYSANSIYKKYDYIIEGKHLGCQGGITNAMVSTSSCSIQIDTIYKAPQYLIDSFIVKKNMVFEKGPQVLYLNDPNKIVLRYWRQSGIIPQKEFDYEHLLELQRKMMLENNLWCFNSETFVNSVPIINEIKFCEHSEKLSSKLKRISKKNRKNRL